MMAGTHKSNSAMLTAVFVVSAQLNLVAIIVFGTLIVASLNKASRDFSSVADIVENPIKLFVPSIRTAWPYSLAHPRDQFQADAASCVELAEPVHDALCNRAGGHYRRLASYLQCGQLVALCPVDGELTTCSLAAAARSLAREHGCPCQRTRYRIFIYC